ANVIARVGEIAAPLLPAVKDRARGELGRLIRQRAARLENVPFEAMVLGADRYLDIVRDGDTAMVRSKGAQSPEIHLKRFGDKWRIVGVRDEQLATDIARAIGDDIVAIAARGSGNGTRNSLGIQNLGDLLREAESVFAAP
ncbi:MAG: hypothetical protein LC730_00855, partial [Acidobacteria bacterium]|nr:hypothetical protein [Acidobacteriota bacterium]